VRPNQYRELEEWLQARPVQEGHRGGIKSLPGAKEESTIKEDERRISRQGPAPSPLQTVEMRNR